MVEFRFEGSFHELALFQLEGRLFVNLRYQGGGEWIVWDLIEERLDDEHV